MTKRVLTAHKCGIAARRKPYFTSRSSGPALGAGCELAVVRAWRAVVRQHLVAQRLQFGIVDPMQPHPDVENGDRYQMCGIAMARRKKAGAAFFQRFENREQSFVRGHNQRFPLLTSVRMVAASHALCKPRRGNALRARRFEILKMLGFLTDIPSGPPSPIP